jgi:hypothetical protein
MTRPSSPPLVLGVASLSGLLLASLSVRADGPSIPPPARIDSSRLEHPWLRFADGVPLPFDSARQTPLVPPLTSGSVAARSLSAADFDGDGIEDLVGGFEVEGRGRLTLWIGTLESRRPRGAEARLRRVLGRFDTPPFLPTRTVIDVDLVPDFLVAGDLDRGGQLDLLVAQLGKEELLWLAGDGHGGFGAPHRMALAGRLTALGSGDVDRRDGLVDLVAAVDGSDGAALEVYESPAGAPFAEPERIPLPSPAGAVTVAWLRNDAPPGIAAVAGSELVLVPGRDRQLFRDPEQRRSPEPLRIFRVPLSADAVDLAIGTFVWNERHDPVAAVLENDGRVEFLSIPSFAPSEAEPPETSRLLPAELLRSVRLEGSLSARFARAHVTGLAAEDLVVFDRADSRLELLLGDATRSREQRVSMGENPPAYPDVSRPLPLATGTPIAALLPLPLGLTSLDDLVVLPASTRSSSPAPIVVPSSVTTTYTVTDTNQSGAGSLYQAITNANGHAGSDYISFSIPVGSSTIPVISTGTYPLPTISENVTIDGSTQTAGYVGIDGTGDPYWSWHGIDTQCDGGALYGLVLSNWPTKAIRLYEYGHWYVRGCRIGTNTAGTAAAGNDTGVSCESWSSSSPDYVGGITAGDGNLVSGNNQVGIDLTGGCIAQGNLVGTNAAGTAAIANGEIGIQSAGYDTIGGALTTARNVISGNPTGVSLGTHSIVQANYIGTNAAGTAKIANTYGVKVTRASNTIGGTSTSARNLISGNSYGVYLNDLSDNSTNGGALNLVEGNWIGLNATGTAALGNYYDGIMVDTEWGSSIGGTTSGAGNVISGNTLYGLQIYNSYGPTYGNDTLVQGNLIGTNSGGSSAIANGVNGILCNQAGWNTIGGTSAAARNVISGNGSTGLRLYQSSGNTVVGNFIGVSSGGVTPLPNGLHGIEIYSGSTNTIGGSTNGAANTISGNPSNGIRIWGTGADANVVTGNYIGLDYAASQARGNTQSGISVEGATNTIIGGSSFYGWNVISGNGGSGILVSGSGATGTWIYGNRIGTNAWGSSAVGNGGDAIRVDGAPAVRIGDGTSGRGSLLSGNSGNGLYVINEGTALLKGAYVGTDYSGSVAIPNVNGVVVNGSPSCAIGGVRHAGEGNLISGNSNIGIFVTGAAATGTTIFGNNIGVSSSGAALPNASAGVWILGAPAVKIGDIDTGDTQNVISGNGSHGVVISGSGASGGRVETNAIGTNAACSVAIPNGGDGVVINGASNCVVGGVLLGNNTNIIAGNVGNGISIYGAGATNNEVTNNYIGTGWQGSPPLGNGGDGIYIQDATGNPIGSATTGGVNTIGANHRHGIELAGTASGNAIRNNAIGINWSLDGAAIGNVLDGIHIGGTASNNAVGGVGPGYPNHVWNSGGAGIAVVGGAGNWLKANQFRSNGGLPIDLGPAGQTPNDVGDGDAGPNNLQNFPVVANYGWSNNQTVVTASLDSAPNTSYHVDLYRDTKGDASWTEWVTESVVATDSSGHASFVFTTPGVLLSPTLVAIDSNGNTSESSRFATGSTVGEVSPGGDLEVTELGSSLQVTYTPATCGPISNVAYIGVGPIGGGVSWDRSVCNLSSYATVTFDPGTLGPSELLYFVLVAQDGVREGAYGKSSNGQQIPQAVGLGACDLPQTPATACF